MSKKESLRKADQQEKKSRAKYKCPDALAKLIDLINKVPLNIKMPPSVVLTRDIQSDNENRDEKILHQLTILLRTLPKDFQDYFSSLQNEVRKETSNATVKHFRTVPKERQPEGNRTSYELVWYQDYRDIPADELEVLCVASFIDKYDEFYDLRENVLKFVETKNAERKQALEVARVQAANDVAEYQTDLDADRTNTQKRFYPVIIGNPFEPNPIGKHLNKGQLLITTPILKDENGKDYLGGFAEHIGTFDSDRLRICEICFRLFWAKRKESETCSALCFNNLRQRLYRNLTAKEKEVRKFQRRLTSQRKKEQREAQERSRRKVV